MILGKIKEKERPSGNKDNYCLTDNEILELCQIGVFLENSYGKASDIEWGIYEVISRLTEILTIFA